MWNPSNDLVSGDRHASSLRPQPGDGLARADRSDGSRRSACDVLVLGATGFTGKLVAEYMLRRYGVGRDVAWGIAGRSRAKLEAVRVALALIDPAASDLPMALADSHDRVSLDGLARQTKVVASTVGPYGIHGADLVAACVEAGTSYCDITGETDFMRSMSDLHHARARETGARIVHACGYDSIPADLGTVMVQTHAKQTHGAICSAVKYLAGPSSGGVSGGTVATLLHLADKASRDPAARKLLADPYALDPGYDGRLRGVRSLVADQRGVAWDEDARSWTGPYPFAATDTRIVRRTNALLGYPWGKDFVFREAMGFSGGAKGWAMAATAAGAMALAVAAARVAPLRKEVAERLLPRPGQGPSPEVRANGFFVSHLVGVLDGDTRVYGLVRGVSDPGYGETSKMLAESAVCLAKDAEVRREGGVLTAGSCLGMRLVERLRDAGMRWETSDSREAVWS